MNVPERGGPGHAQRLEDTLLLEVAPVGIARQGFHNTTGQCVQAVVVEKVAPQVVLDGHSVAHLYHVLFIDEDSAVEALGDFVQAEQAGAVRTDVPQCHFLEFSRFLGVSELRNHGMDGGVPRNLSLPDEQVERRSHEGLG